MEVVTFNNNPIGPIGLTPPEPEVIGYCDRTEPLIQQWWTSNGILHIIASDDGRFNTVTTVEFWARNSTATVDEQQIVFTPDLNFFVCKLADDDTISMTGRSNIRLSSPEILETKFMPDRNGRQRLYYRFKYNVNFTLAPGNYVYFFRNRTYTGGVDYNTGDWKMLLRDTDEYGIISGNGRVTDGKDIVYDSSWVLGTSSGEPTGYARIPGKTFWLKLNGVIV